MFITIDKELSIGINDILKVPIYINEYKKGGKTMEERIFDNEVLNAFHIVIDHLPQLMDEPTAIYLVDNEKYKVIRNIDELPLKSQIDQDINPVVKQMINKGERLVSLFDDKNSSEVPLKSYILPIKNDSGKIEGAVLMGKSLKKRQELLSVSETLRDSLEQITHAINDLNENIQEVVDANEQIMSIVHEANSKTADTNEILDFIQGISSQTNLLGLNAAIEASRAGEYGRGFDVVAKEIRKLSTSTSESIRKVDEVLKNIGTSIKNINDKVTDTNTVFETQASSLEEIAASIQELNATAQIMYSFAENI